MADIFTTDFFLRKRNETIRNAILISNANFLKNLPSRLSIAIDQLIQWAGEYPYRMGYAIKEAKIETQEQDYARNIGVGVFLECEKYDDVRGLLLTAFETANELKESNDRIRETNDSLKEKIQKFCDTHPISGAKFFPEFMEDNLEEDEDD